VLFVFDGRDAAGEGGMIRAITEPVTQCGLRLVALPAPTDWDRTPIDSQRSISANGSSISLRRWPHDLLRAVGAAKVWLTMDPFNLLPICVLLASVVIVLSTFEVGLRVEQYLHRR
jgi:hypothetical protein